MVFLLKKFYLFKPYPLKILIDIDIISFSCLCLWVRLIHIEWFGLSPIFTVFFICESGVVVKKNRYSSFTTDDHYLIYVCVCVCVCNNVVSWWSWRSMTWFCHHTSTHCASPSSSCVTPPPLYRRSLLRRAKCYCSRSCMLRPKRKRLLSSMTLIRLA